MRVAVGLVVVGVLAGCAAENPTVQVQTAPVVPTVLHTQDFAVPVLMYHRICHLTERESRSPLLRDLTVSPADFEDQVRYLAESGYTFLHVSEVSAALREGKPLPVKSVAITMDDGYRDNFTFALPILKKYRAKATVFMVTNNFDRPERLSWTDARHMVARDVAFESHTVSHPDLTTLSQTGLRHELRESRRILEEGLRVAVTSIAYPAGAFNSSVELMVADAGYLAAWKKGGGVVEPRHRESPYQLPRIRIHGRTDMAKFRERVASGPRVVALRTQEREARSREGKPGA